MTDSTIFTRTNVTDIIQALAADAAPNTKTEINERIINTDINFKDQCNLIRELTLDGVLKDIHINDTAHWIPNNTKRAIETENYTIKATTTDTSARFVSNEHSMLVQRLKDRYQITLWWDANDDKQQTTDCYINNPALGESDPPRESTIPETTPIIVSALPEDDEDTIGHIVDISPRTDMQNAIAVLTVKEEANAFNISLYLKNNVEQSEVTTLTTTFEDPRKTIG
jgi:hypothetical protein